MKRKYGFIFFISGYLFVLLEVLLNPINIIIDILVLSGFFLITLGFLLFFLKLNKEV